MKDFFGWLATGALFVVFSAVGLAPVIAVVGAAVAMGVVLRTGPIAALGASVGLAILWMAALCVVEIPVKLALAHASRAVRDTVVDVVGVLLLALCYFIIVERFLACVLMALLAAALYHALGPVIERAEHAADALPRDET